jgi:hypothetical protein
LRKTRKAKWSFGSKVSLEVNRQIKLHLEGEMRIYSVHPEKKDVNYHPGHLQKAR